MEVLGINPVLLIAQLISFGVLVYVLNRFLYKSVRETLAKRRETIKNTAENALEVEKRLLALEESKKSLKQENQAELKTLLAEAKSSAESLRKETISETEARAQKLLDEAHAQILRDSEKAQEELKTQAVVLAKQMVEKVLEAKQKDKVFQKKLIDKNISEL